MATLNDLSKQIETLKLDDSKAEELKGPNVRTPSLISGQLYLVKCWKPVEQGSDNVWKVVQFLGSGHQEDADSRIMFEENPRIKDMKNKDYYIFEHIKEGKTTELLAYQAEECLVFGTPPVRITFFELKDITVQTKPNRNKKAAKSLKPTKSTVGPAKRKATKAKVTLAAKNTATEVSIEEVNTEVTGETPALSEQEMPEAVADNSERSTDFISEQENEAVENAIDADTLEDAEHQHSAA